MTLRVAGASAEADFAGEAGGHRWQRVPPTERRGRVHSSTITVAVLPEVSPTRVVLAPQDLRFETCRAGGKGGQHLQKNDTAVRVVHLPTGLSVRCEARSQKQNKRQALAILRARLFARAEEETATERRRKRRKQAGRGQRADKRRTVAVQRGEVVDHRTGRRTTVKRYQRGFLDDLAPG